jgi:hypothetical protein
LLEEISSLKNRVSELESAASHTVAPHTQGKQVTTELHFGDVNLEEIDTGAFIEDLRERLALQAGVDVSMVTISSLRSTGSATANIEISYPEVGDESNNDQLDENREKLIQFLNDTESVSNEFSSYGGVDISKTEEGEILSISAKVIELQNRLDAEELTFQASSLRLSDFKLQTSNKGVLKLLHYDPVLGDYIGGTLQLDI